MDCIGWLSPTGDLIKCDGHAHVVKAMELAKRYYEQKVNVRADDTLLRHGWVRISKLTYNDKGLYFFMPERLTPVQRAFLEQVYNNTTEPISCQGMAILRAWDII